MKHQFTGTIILLLALSALVYIVSNTPTLVSPSSTKPREQSAPRVNVEDHSSIYSPAAVDTTPKISIGSVSVREYPDFFSTVIIYHQGGDAANVTGWRVKSNRNEFIIPQAVEVYDPAGGNPAGDIYVTLNVIVPPANDEQARALYKEMESKLAFNPRAGLGA